MHPGAPKHTHVSLPPSDWKQFKAAVGAKLGEPVESIEVEEYHTQVVAGVNYKVVAKVQGKRVVIGAFKPLPHTGNAVEVKTVEVQ